MREHENEGRWMSLRSSGLHADVRFAAKATELLRRREMTRCANIGPMPQLCGLLAWPASIQNIEHWAVGDSAVGTLGNRFRQDGLELGEV